MCHKAEANITKRIVLSMLEDTDIQKYFQGTYIRW